MWGPAGVNRYGAQILENLISSGVAVLEGTTVRGPTSFMGTLTCNNATLNTVEVKGTLTTTNSTFQGVVQVIGMLTPVKSIFRELLTVQTKALILDDTQTKGIRIQKNPDTPRQVVKLLGNSRVEGDITFEQGPGVVDIAATATLTGQVIGGILNRL